MRAWWWAAGREEEEGGSEGGRVGLEEMGLLLRSLNKSPEG